MTSTSVPLPEPRHRPLTATASWPLVSAAVVGVSLGALTAFAQGWLPASAASLANSAGPWTLVAAALASVATTARAAAIAGALTLTALLVGYVLGATAQGAHASSSLLLFWGAAALVVGPVVGISAHWIRHPTRGPAPLATGALAGVLIGEGVYGLTVIASSTSPWYWSIELLAGALLLVALSARRLRRPRSIGLAVLATAVVACGVIVTYKEGLGLLG